MKHLRIPLHGFVLGLLNLVSIWAGNLIYFYGFYRPGAPFQFGIKLPAACLFNAAAFALWFFLAGRLSRQALSITRAPEYAWTWLAALLAAPAIFIPLHYATQHYLTAPGNLIGLGLYQAPVNAILFFGLWIVKNIPSESAKATSLHSA